mgnify:FL=1
MSAQNSLEAEDELVPRLLQELEDEDEEVAQVFVERLLAAKAMESQLAMMSKIHSAEQSTLLESIRDLVERRRQRKHNQEERNARMNHMLKQMDTRLRQEQAQRKLAQDAVQAFKSESSIIMSQLQDSLANVTQQYKQEVSNNAQLSRQLHELSVAFDEEQKRQERFANTMSPLGHHFGSQLHQEALDDLQMLVQEEREVREGLEDQV